MFERFNDRARRAVVLAQEEARMLNDNYIGTEHVLLGLVHEGEGVAAKALESLGISLEATRRQVEEIIGRGRDPATGHIPFTPRARKVLELSLREALHLGHGSLGTGHLLLGLIREGEGVGIQVLSRLGADLQGVRNRTLELLAQDPEEPAGRGVPSASPGAPASPACPRCSASLEDHLACKTMEVTEEGAERHASVTMFYCGECGATIGAAPPPREP
ncbi:MAG: hypothetical protein HY775_03295 [Acidobacteria bacterium]|nr:hypothetical protein [Acidobacteriota bacterium]